MKKEKQTFYDANSETQYTLEPRVLQDVESGEFFQTTQVQKMYFGRKNWWKVWLTDFLNILGIVDSKQLDVMIFILENTQQHDNLFIGTIQKISEQTHVSRPTCYKIVNKMLDANMMVRIQNGVYRVNPAILMRGSDEKQRAMLITYRNEQDENQLSIFDDEDDN